jgi:hypothetical protein
LGEKLSKQKTKHRLGRRTPHALIAHAVSKSKLAETRRIVYAARALKTTA